MGSSRWQGLKATDPLIQSPVRGAGGVPVGDGRRAAIAAAGGVGLRPPRPCLLYTSDAADDTPC
eukprot:7398911-Pyramimonas_sp.AAC.1